MASLLQRLKKPKLGSREASMDHVKLAHTATSAESYPQISPSGNSQSAEKRTEAGNSFTLETKAAITSSSTTTGETSRGESEEKTESETQAEWEPPIAEDLTETPSISGTNTIPTLSENLENDDRPISTLVPQLSSSHNTVPPALIEREPLWDEAYDLLRLDYPYLVAQYEEILSLDIESIEGETSATEITQNFISQNDPKARWHQMCRLLSRWLDNQDSISTGDLQDIIKDYIRNSTGTAPPSSLAWTCVCYASRVLLSPHSKTKAVCHGFKYIMAKLDWYNCLSRLVIRDDVDEPQERGPALRKRVVALYKEILSYLMTAVMLTDRQFQSWDANLERLKAAEESLSTFSGDLIMQKLDDILLLTQENRQRSPTRKHSAIISEEIEQKLACLGEIDTASGLIGMKSDNEFLAHELCRWICSTEEYKSVVNWGSDQNQGSESGGEGNKNISSQVLLIGSGPGINKTVLLEAIIQHLSEKASLSEAELNRDMAQLQEGSKHGQHLDLSGLEDPDDSNSGRNDEIGSRKISWALSYYSCGQTSHGIDNSSRVLRSLIHSLLQQQQELIHHLDEALSSTERSRFDGPKDFTALLGVFFRMLNDQAFIRSYLVVDGIDECSSGDGGDGDDLNDLLRLINATRNVPQKVRWIVSANANTRIEWELRKGENLQYVILEEASEVHKLSETFRRNVDYMVKELTTQRKYPEEIKKEVAKIISQKSQGNTLWAVIACATLRNEDNWYAVKVLEEMPQHLDGLYKYAKSCLEALPRQDPEFCISVLSTMAIAHRPLRVSELASLAKLPPFVDLEVIIEKCRSFLEIQRETETVKFVDPSASITWKPLHDSTEFSQAHSRLVRKSLESLSTHFESFTLDFPNFSSGQKQSKLRGLNDRYGTIHWLMHLLNVEDIINDVKTTNSVVSFMQSHLLLWLAAMISDGLHIDTAILLRKLENRLTSQSKEKTLLLSLVQDAHRIIHSHTSGSSIFHGNSNSVIFYPEKSSFKQYWVSKNKAWLVVSPEVAQNWNDSSLILTHHTDYVRSIAFSPDGRLLASGSDDRTVRIWDTETGTAQLTLENHDYWVVSVAFSTNGLLASCSNEIIYIWDLSTGDSKTLPDYDEEIKIIRFSADGKKLIAGTDKTLLWDLTDFDKPIMQVLEEGGPHFVYAVDFSPRGTWMASGSTDDIIRIWDTNNNELQKTMQGHKADVNSIAFSWDEERLVSGSDDRTVKIWSVSTGTILQNLECQYVVLGVAISPDGSLIAATNDEEVKVWEGKAFEREYVMRGHKRSVRAVAFSPQGRLASGSADMTVRLWGSEGSVGNDMNALKETSKYGSVSFMAVSPDGQYLASASGDEIYLWDAKTGQLRRTHELLGHFDTVKSVWFSPDGKSLVSASADFSVRLWDVASGTIRRTFSGHSDWVRLAIFSPDGGYIASASDDFTIRIWHCPIEGEDEEEAAILEGHDGYIRAIAFSPDGKLLVSGGDDRKMIIWDRTSPQPNKLFEVTKHSDWIIGIIFSQDSSRIVSRSDDYRVWVWDSSTGDLIQGPILTGRVQRYAWFDPRMPEYFLTEFGADPSTLGSSSFFSTKSLKGKRYGISAAGDWITWNGREIIPIPEMYRPTASWVQGNTVAIGTKSGKVLLFQFSADVEPPN